MALMASQPPTCTTLPAALCEKHFSRRKPRQRFLNACGVPSGGNFGLSWPCRGKLWAALGRLLASPGGPWDGSVVPFGLCYPTLEVFGLRRHASNLDLATVGAGPGWIFCASRIVLAHALGPSRWIALLPLLHHRCVVRPLWPASAASVSLLPGPERDTCRRQLRIPPILKIFEQNFSS